MKSYEELCRLNSFEERFKYLSLNGNVGEYTFGVDRFINQNFYMSAEWKRVRDFVIIRDNGFDMGLDGYPIIGNIFVHHINPLTKEDIINHSEKLFDPNNLICVSKETHNAIHYGDNSYSNRHDFVERKPGDTKLW